MENTDGEQVRIARLSSFTIVRIQPQSNTNYVKMTLKSLSSGNEYTKQVTFVNDNVTGDIDGYKEDYYNYLFNAGTANLSKIPAERRKKIQMGKVEKDSPNRKYVLPKANHTVLLRQATDGPIGYTKADL